MTTMHAILPGPEMQWAETERPEPGPGQPEQELPGIVGLVATAVVPCSP